MRKIGMLFIVLIIHLPLPGQEKVIGKEVCNESAAEVMLIKG